MKHEVDIHGMKISLGDTVARATTYGRSAHLSVCVVTKVDEQGRIYLDNSHQHIRTASSTLKVLP